MPRGPPAAGFSLMYPPSTSNPATPAVPPVRVGRLVPAVGVAPRAQPDRDQLRQFLREVQLPLAAIQAMLELAEAPTLPLATRMALRAAGNHADHLLDLVGDYVELDRLEAESVTPRPVVVELQPWIDGCLATQRHKTARSGNELRSQHRSFLPSRVEFDAALAARAIDAVLRVAVLRALPGHVDVRIAYTHDRNTPAHSELQIEIATRGGGFDEIESGYVFLPFSVRDGSSRPLLGLGNAQRLCTLLGGYLRVQSDGPAAASYKLSMRARPCPGAVWVDPLGDGEQPQATVWPV